jgi:hypothetical protein
MLLYSKRLLEYLTALRGSPSRIDPLPDDERVALEELILRGGKDDLGQGYLPQIYSVWRVMLTDPNTISLPCPYSVDIIYNCIFHRPQRPKNDEFTSLCDFMRLLEKPFRSVPFKYAQFGSQGRHIGSSLGGMACLPSALIVV